MSPSFLVGLVLVVVAVVDVAVGFLVLGPRLPEANRPIVLLGIGLGAVLILVLGVAFLAGWIPLGASAGGAG